MIDREVSILYRTYGGENDAPRPKWYSKELCLKSMVMAYDLLKQKVPATFTVLFDGNLNLHDEWSKELKKAIEPRGVIIVNKQQGNCESTINAIHKASELPESNIVVVAEDDYLWLAESLIGLYNSLHELPADYSTPYDHPVRYLANYPSGADLPHWHTTIYLTQERHWRSQESTCMTFASSAGTIKQDLEYFEKYKNNGKNRPGDRELFRDLQGLGKYETANPRLLVGPMPALSTHVHLPWLSPVIDWEKVAYKIEEKNE